MTAVALGLARDAPVSALVNADGHCALARCLGVVLSIYRRRAATPYPFSGRRLALTDGGVEWGGRGGGESKKKKSRHTANSEQTVLHADTTAQSFQRSLLRYQSVRSMHKIEYGTETNPPALETNSFKCHIQLAWFPFL